MLSQNTALWLRQKWMHSGLPKAFVSSVGILNLPITSLPVDNFHDRALWCKSTGINYNMHGWILCRYCATGWFWWISGLRAVTMWSSSSFTKTIFIRCLDQAGSSGYCKDNSLAAKKCCFSLIYTCIEWAAWCNICPVSSFPTVLITITVTGGSVSHK